MTMDRDTLLQLLQQSEGPKLEFKCEWYKLEDPSLRDAQWGELQKDIVALANGGVGYVGQAGYLIIGADDRDPAPGEERETCDVPVVGKHLTSLSLLKRKLLEKIANQFTPAMPDINIEFVALEPETRLLVFSIPPTRKLMALQKNLTAKALYRNGTVIYRDGQEVKTADVALIDRLRAEFQLLTPPIRNPKFVGRDTELHEAADILVGGRPLILSGLAGVGKSALATELLNQPELQAEFPGGLIWIDASDRGLSQICRLVYQKLNPEDRSLTDDEAASRLRQVLSSRSDVLVTLDDISEPSVGRDFCEKVWPHTLITSRHQIRTDNAENLAIHSPQPTVAQKIFTVYAGREFGAGDVPALGQVVELVGCHPLALKIAAYRLQTEGISLAELLSWLKDPHYRLDALQIIEEQDSAQASVIKSFSISWERIARHHPNAQPVFKTLACFAPSGCSLAALAHVAQVELRSCREAMGVLIRAGLVEQNADHRYFTHALLRDFGQRLTTVEERETLAGQFVDWGLIYAAAALIENFDDEGAPDLRVGEQHRQRFYTLGMSYPLDYLDRKVTGRSTNALEVELANLLAAVDLADRHEKWYEFGLLCMMLNNSLSGVLTIRGHWTESVRLARRLHQVVSEFVTGLNPEYVAIVLSQILRYQGQFEEAEALQSEIDRWKELMEDGSPRLMMDPFDLQIWMLAGGITDTATWQAKRKELLPARMELVREAGDDFHIGHTAWELGQYYRDRDQLAEAQAAYEEGLQALERLGDIRGQIEILERLGDLAIDLGQFAKAQQLIDRALDEADRHELSDPLVSARMTLGQAIFASGDLAKARSIFLAVEPDIAQAQDERGLASCWMELALIARMESDWSTVSSYLRRVLQLPADALSAETRNLHWVQLAEALYQSGDRNAARREWQSMYDVALQNSDCELGVAAMVGLMGLAGQRGDWQTVRKLAKEGRRLVKKTVNPLRLANYHYFLAQLARHEKADRKQIREHLTAARDALAVVEDEDAKVGLAEHLAAEAFLTRQMELVSDFLKLRGDRPLPLPSDYLPER
jgi:tetratricopeptide (TPR) repeat protein